MKPKIVVFVLLAASLLIGGCDFALYGRTLTNLLPLLALSVIAAVALWFPAASLWKRIFGDRLKTIFCFLVHCVSVSSLVLFAILALNYFGADNETSERHKAVVTGRYYNERQTSNRVGRRHYSAPSRKYKVYYMTLRFDDGRTKDVQITLDKYNRIKTGTVYPVAVYDGLLGMPVVKEFP